MEDFFKIIIISLTVYGGLYLLGTSKKPGYRTVRRKKKATTNYLERETRILEREIIKESGKRKHKQDKISEIAKKKPERIASAIQKWLLENGGKPVH